ncbi:flagellar basal-body rod protein FlgG [Ramlibacter solisilvae]|uniref:Flagellar basal-body rod protein FlgG n=1 Tax=Ramlibacter tataouinensis TaxID=94132 RepID=A0A127JW05_9BURK|nr:flagellar basal-body rod protein FlgG [Ramlibacter tataouinensis]AMO22202.1 flagellar basal-body rod protein FlgG [Ramlibacter tataouinensis]
MFDALSIGATGMLAQQQNVETIANNLANANTVAFKKGRVGFSDLMVREGNRVALAGMEESRNGTPASAQRLGAGVGIAAMSKVFEAGELKKTDSPLDLAIRGEGFLEVSMPDGSSAVTRGGTLRVKDGALVTQAGYPLKPSIALPDNAKSLVIGADGRVLVTVPNQVNPVELGQIEVVRFANPGLLISLGDNLYRAGDGTGDAISARPGEDGAGSLAQGFLEASNVKMVDEMVNLMLAQRAYEASVKVVQAADEMLGLVNNLRK